MVKLIGLAALVFFASLLTSPASADSSVPAATEIPVPPAGKGEVVFFRSGTFIGSAISCAVSENGQKVSSLPPGDYFIAVAEPGKHTYLVSSEATDRLTVQVEADEIQYASCHIKMGIMAGRPALAPESEAAFKAKKYKLVAAAKMGEGALRPDGTTSAHPQAFIPAPTAVAAPIPSPATAPIAAASGSSLAHASTTSQ